MSLTVKRSTNEVTPAIRAALKGWAPTAEQWAAISAPLGPVHVIAGAGSGKTAVMAARIVYLVEQLGIEPSSVLALTFTNKAAAELEARVSEALAEQLDPAGGPAAGAGAAEPVTVHTYHAFAADLVQAYGVRVGVEQDADLLSEAQQYQLLLAILDSERFQHLSVRIAGAAIRKALELAAACADHLVEPARVIEASRALIDRYDAGEPLPSWQVQAACERIELAGLVERYTQEKQRRGRIDFGDQVAKAVELVERHQDLVEALRARYPHVLLDEYQDTNVAQRRLIQQLCPPGASIMAVGDARQAIYAFRGATMYNLLSFPEHFPASEPEGNGTQHQVPQSLSTNFRSGRRILGLANSVIEAIPEERRGGLPLQPAPGAGEGAVLAALLGDQFAEAAFVADQVVRAHTSGLPGGSGGLKSEAPAMASGGPRQPSGSPPVNQGSGGLKSEAPAMAFGSPGQPSGSPPVNQGSGGLKSEAPAMAFGSPGQPSGSPPVGQATLPAWRDVAVLVRSKRLLGPLREALEQRDVPVEVVGLQGLLETPEIVDLVSMLRVIEDPGANVPLARLLLGPRWRIGYRHLVRLARWASRHNWGLKDVLPGEDPDPGDVSFALAEALDHLDEVDGLDDEARRRLRAFRRELRYLRAAADAPLLDLVETVLERTGVWAELEASSDRRALSARQNLATFLDRVAAFAPVDGDPSLAAFLAYLDAVQDAAEPVEATAPAPADSVKLMTVHMAKGLEFPMVVVAGLSAATAKDGTPKHGIFPDLRVADPRRAQGFPYELREDAAHLPRWSGNARAFRQQLDQRALEDERRLFYVAVTRAKQLLVLTAAWWYQGSEKTPKGPSPFWDEAAAHPAATVLARTDQPATSPLAERLRSRVQWPPPARLRRAPVDSIASPASTLDRRPEEAADPLFPEGVAAAVELTRRDPAAIAARVPPAQVAEFEAALAAGRNLQAAAGGAPRLVAPLPPRILSVSQVLTYARCPRDFYWTVVRPLPTQPRVAARLGTVVHRLLERRARGLPDLVDVGDLGGESPAGFAEPSLVERATRNFTASPYAHLPVSGAEVGVVLRSGQWVLRGRIDAIFRTPDGVELVDWKTGRRRPEPNPAGLDQLGIYALALRQLGQLPPEGCTASYCYLGGDHTETDPHPYGPAELDEQHHRLEATLAALAAADFERRCGLDFCPTCSREQRDG